jgi:hypothetical protein
MRSLRGANAAAVLIRLNPIIRGWAAYYRGVVSSQAFAGLDHYMWKLVYKWACFRHPDKPRQRAAVVHRPRRVPLPSDPHRPDRSGHRDIECRHREHAHVEDRIRDDKDTGLSKFPFKEYALNQVWLEIVMLAHDLIVWTQALVLDGELAKAEPKRLRYRLLHVAARLAFSARRAKLHLQNTWPWVTQLKAAFERLKALPAATG